MSLRPEPDLDVAEWIVSATNETDPTVVTRQGPPGLQAHATIWFDTPDSEAPRAEPDLVALVTSLAAEHTATPERSCFALWDGWGEIDEGRFYGVMDVERGFGRVFSGAPARIAPPAFGDAVLSGPRLQLTAERSYLLFTGSLADVGDWGARPLAPGWPRELPQASFTWPADRAWCLTSDPEAEWFCLGGPPGLVEAVLAHPDLQAEPATHGVPPTSRD